MLFQPCRQRRKLLLRDGQGLQVQPLRLPVPARALGDGIMADRTVHGVPQLSDVSDAVLDPSDSIGSCLDRRVNVRFGRAWPRRYPEIQSPRQPLAHLAPALIHPAEVEGESRNLSATTAKAVLHSIATVTAARLARNKWPRRATRAGRRGSEAAVCAAPRSPATAPTPVSAHPRADVGKTRLGYCLRFRYKGRRDG